MTTNTTTTNTNGPALWHPFADMGAVSRQQLVLTRGLGAYVWDGEGRRYLDATAALWYSNIGHGRPEIADAVADQLRRLDAYSIFGDYANEPSIELAERLSDLAPVPGSKVFLGAGGGDAVDTAAKIARRYHTERGEPGRMHLIGREHGYHGTHGIGTSVGGIPANQEGFGALVPDTSSVAYDDPAALLAEIERVGADRVAAFICEPVIGAGGVHPPPDGYIEAVAKICRDDGILFIADCVISGFGRLGTWLGIDRWDVKPDLITLAKGLTGGTMPVGAVIAAAHVAEPFFTGEPGSPVLRHGATYAGHPACCAAANVTLDIYERESLIERGRTLEQPLADALAGLADDPLVREVRAGLGFLAGIDLDDDLLAANPGIVARWQLACRQAGVLVRPLSRGIAVSPPLTVGQDEIDEIASGIGQGLAQLSLEVRAAA